jgi:outer membrane protein
MQFLKISGSFLLIIFSLSFVPMSVSAADLSFSAGGGIWRNEGTGELRYKDNPTVDIDYLDYDKENRGYIWAELRHPVPFLPNFRVEYVDLKFSGHSSHAFAWDDVAFKADAYSETTLTQLDMILFYNVLSLPWVDLDLGADVKYIDFTFDAEGEGRSLDNPSVRENLTEHEDETAYIPFIYSRVRANIPATNFGIEGDVKYITYKNTTVLDTSIKANYFFALKAVKLGIEAGYRFESIDVDEDDFSGLTFDIDVDLKGPFAGVFIKF